MLGFRWSRGAGFHPRGGGVVVSLWGSLLLGGMYASRRGKPLLWVGISMVGLGVSLRGTVFGRCWSSCEFLSAGSILL